MHAVLTAAPGELADRFDIRHPDGRPVSRRAAGLPRDPRRAARAAAHAEHLAGDRRLHWFLTKATPLEDEAGGLLAVNVIEDVTEEHEAALRQRFLAEAGQALASSLDYEETLQRVAQLAVPRLADWCAIELPDERGQLQQVALAHVDPARVARPASCASATRPIRTRPSARTR